MRIGSCISPRFAFDSECAYAFDFNIEYDCGLDSICDLDSESDSGVDSRSGIILSLSVRWTLIWIVFKT